VYGVFRSAGYPEPVAHLLTGLTTNVVPPDVRREAARPPAHLVTGHRRMLQHLAHPHLPQGAPTSPALANLAACHLDRRLGALARAFGAEYTRYADDLAFSGPARLRRSQPALVRLVAEIARDEGFRLNGATTRVTTQSQRQRLGGLVVNARANVARHEYDRLRAVLQLLAPSRVARLDPRDW
jgi:RNA-directed DNA polymerase